LTARVGPDVRQLNPGLASRRQRAALVTLFRSGSFWRIAWGVADQGASSITNFAVVFLMAHSVSASQFGAFSLAYVAYGFALNAERSLAAYPLQVKFSGSDISTWRRAVASSTATATMVGVVAGACSLVAAAFMSGASRAAFVALGLSLPGLMLQDSWRYAFFVLGRGSQAFLNDTTWALALLPALILLHATGNQDVFWYVLAWGVTASIGAAVGPLQSRVIPKLASAKDWLLQTRELGPRYVLADLIGSASSQVRADFIGSMLGLAAVGYVQASSTVMGPFTIVFYGVGLVTVPEAARLIRRSPRRLPVYCFMVSVCLAAAAFAWGLVLLVSMPRGLGNLMLGHIWRSTYPLVFAQTFVIVAQGFGTGATTGIAALGAAKRNLRTMIITSVVLVACSVSGVLAAGTIGAVVGSAVSAWIGVPIVWWQLRVAIRESAPVAADSPFWPSRPTGRHRQQLTLSDRSEHRARGELRGQEPPGTEATAGR
jgi:O-antigen/teichoic acid export membrane protein